jgi:pSer/pThr/pTyr-binding forkhead associated (FHA) protein
MGLRSRSLCPDSRQVRLNVLQLLCVDRRQSVNAFTLIILQKPLMPQFIASVEGVEIMRFSPKKAKTTLGRKRQNDIVLDNMVVSGEHCVFDMDKAGVVHVSDLGSTNGTYLNGKLIRSRELLRDNDTLGVGNFNVQYLAETATPSSFSHDDLQTVTLDSIGFPGTTGVKQAALRVLNGSSAGLDVPIIKAVTTFGRPGTAVMSVSHRRDGYYAGCMGDRVPILLNGKPIGQSSRLLDHGDVLDLAGTRMEFRLAGL